VAGVDESFAVFSGEDTLLPVHLAAGAKGGIVVTASLLPSAWKQVVSLALEGRTSESMALHRRLIPLMNLAFAETNPGPMKSVMDLIGVNAPEVLDPLVAPAEGLQAALRKELVPLLEEFEGVK